MKRKPEDLKAFFALADWIESSKFYGWVLERPQVGAKELARREPKRLLAAAIKNSVPVSCDTDYHAITPSVTYEYKPRKKPKKAADVEAVLCHTLSMPCDVRCTIALRDNSRFAGFLDDGLTVDDYDYTIEVRYL